MTIVGIVLAGAAALVHLYIFILESLTWESARTRAIFRSGTVEQARETKFLAFNQGFYNLFLALLVLIGIVLWFAGALVVGLTLIFAGTGSMLAAALVLLFASPKHRKAATFQGAAPLLAILALVVGAFAA